MRRPSPTSAYCECNGQTLRDIHDGHEIRVTCQSLETVVFIELCLSVLNGRKGVKRLYAIRGLEDVLADLQILRDPDASTNHLFEKVH